ncbi:hypothetical protein AMECASPLE_027391, partial [Ameca splendens]
VSLTPARTLMTICGLTFSFQASCGLRIITPQLQANKPQIILSLPSFTTDLSFFPRPRRIILQTSKHLVSRHCCFPPDLNTCSSQFIVR